MEDKEGQKNMDEEDEGEEEGEQKLDIEILNLSKEKRLFGVKINNQIFLATMVDLPCVIEAMKTLDFYNFYKSQDAS
jgi:TAFII55 protein conserved region